MTSYMMLFWPLRIGDPGEWLLNNFFSKKKLKVQKNSFRKPLKIQMFTESLQKSKYAVRQLLVQKFQEHSISNVFISSLSRSLIFEKWEHTRRTTAKSWRLSFSKCLPTESLVYCFKYWYATLIKRCMSIFIIS